MNTSCIKSILFTPLKSTWQIISFVTGKLTSSKTRTSGLLGHSNDLSHTYNIFNSFFKIIFHTVFYSPFISFRTSSLESAEHSSQKNSVNEEKTGSDKKTEGQQNGGMYIEKANFLLFYEDNHALNNFTHIDHFCHTLWYGTIFDHTYVWYLMRQVFYFAVSGSKITVQYRRQTDCWKCLIASGFNLRTNILLKKI